MTRQDILDEYTVSESGIILDFGQFEQQMIYVPYFWDSYLNGFADEDEDGILTFNVDDKDREQFPELAGIETVRLYQTSQGFVCAE